MAARIGRTAHPLHLLRRPDSTGVATGRLALYAAFLLPALGPLSRVTHVQLSVPAFAALAAWIACEIESWPRGRGAS